MRSKKLRIFWVNETEMIFNIRLFQELFIKYANKNNIGLGAYEEALASVLFVDKSAVHNWRMNVNGPGNIEIIQNIARFWHINYETLFMEANDMNTEQDMNIKRLTEAEKVALKNVYREFLNYMEQFKNTTGFLWYADGSDYQITNAYARYENLRLTLKMEYIDLKRTVYDKIEELFNGELSYTLEESFLPEEETVEQYEADVMGLYEHLLNTFYEIVDEYLVD